MERKMAVGFVVLLALVALVLGEASVWAQQTIKYPTKAVEILVGYGAGGASDITARILAPHLEKIIGQPVIVVNKPGGGGEIAYTMLAKANLDGYTLGLINSPATISIPLSRKVSYSMSDFAYIGNIIYHENLIVVKPDSKIKTFEDFIAEAKAKAGKLNVGNSGPYADDHLASLALQHAAGIKVKDTPFQGTAPSLVSLLGGHIDAVVCNVADIVEKVKQEQVRVVFTMGEKRNELFPNAPTMKEKGLNVVMGNYTTLGAPAKTPPEILNKLIEAMKQAMSSPEFIIKSGDAKLPVRYFSAEEIAKIYKQDTTTLENLWKTLNLPTQK